MNADGNEYRSKPEVQRALAYLERKGTHAPRVELIKGIRQALIQLESRFESIPTAGWTFSASPAAWSAHEILDHLVASHRPALDQLRRALNGKDPGDAIPAGLRSTDFRDRDHRPLLEELKAIHRGLLKELDDAVDPSSPPSIPVAMVLKVQDRQGRLQVLEWIEDLHWKAFALGIKVHSLEHLAQLDRLAAAWKGSAP